MPYTSAPSSSAKITNSGLMRSVCPKIVRRDDVALDLLQRDEQQRDPERGERVLNSATSTGGSAPRNGPTYGMSSMKPKKIAEGERVRLAVAGRCPSTPKSYSPSAGAGAHRQAEQQLPADVAGDGARTRVG